MVVRATELATTRLTKSLKEKVQKIAKGERRSLSLMLEILVEEAVQHRESAESEKGRDPLMAQGKHLALNQ